MDSNDFLVCDKSRELELQKWTKANMSIMSNQKRIGIRYSTNARKLNQVHSGDLNSLLDLILSANDMSTCQPLLYRSSHSALLILWCSESESMQEIVLQTLLFFSDVESFVRLLVHRWVSVESMPHIRTFPTCDIFCNIRYVFDAIVRSSKDESLRIRTRCGDADQ